MSGDLISDELKRFVLTSIPSVPFLEAMLLLRSEPAAEWDGKRLSRRLYISERAAAQLLHELHAADLARLASRTLPAYCYAPATDVVRGIVDQLAAAYAANLVEITNLIHSGNKTLYSANAFRLQK